MILPFCVRSALPRCLRHVLRHILNKDPISRGGVIDENMRHRSDNLAVLNDRAAAHECGQVGTTKFIKKSFLVASFFLHLEWKKIVLPCR